MRKERYKQERKATDLKIKINKERKKECMNERKRSDKNKKKGRSNKDKKNAKSLPSSTTAS